MSLDRLVIAAALVFCAACDPILTRGIAVNPSPAAVRDSVALRILGDVAKEYRMTQSGTAGMRWRSCYGGGSVSVCSQRVRDEVQIVMTRRGFQWTPYADSVRTTLLSELRASFGESVRECEWVYIELDAIRGCQPLVLVDSSRS